MKLLFTCFWLGFVHAAEWSYTGSHGVEYWSRDYEACGGRRQSPINIPWELQYNNYAPFNMTGYDNMAAYGLELFNSGHTAQISIDTLSLGKTTVSGGGLDGTYIAVQLHFHWGENDEEGSEHVFKDRKYPLEMHIVHFKESYGSITEAVKHGDGLAVLGIFFVTEGAEENPSLKPLIDSLDSISFKDTKTPITIDFSDLMPESNAYFYRYMGSLTTPTCNEAVVWTVFENKNYISSAQLAKFRQLYETKSNEKRHTIAFNYRPPQNLFDRTVYKNFEEDVPKSWHWGYEGIEGAKYWKDYYHTCSGNQQSPINIPHWNMKNSGLAKFDPKLNLDTLEFRNYDKEITGTIINNGHTIQINIDNDDIYLMNGGLDGKYIATQFHFHWGHDDTEGSEHTLEGKAYPLELHIVHYKETYKNLAGALPKKDGLAVVGFFFKAGGVIRNENYGKIVDHLQDVKYKDSSKAVSGFSLKDLTYEGRLKLDNATGYSLPYYRYAGGLTTPPCYEIVTWSVMRNPIYITPEEIAAFREVSHVESGTIGSHDKIKINFRPVQSLDGREVYQSVNITEIYTDATSGLLPSILSMAAILLFAALL